MCGSERRAHKDTEENEERCGEGCGVVYGIIAVLHGVSFVLEGR